MKHRPDSKAPKRPYKAPRLKVYGTVAAITRQFSNSRESDKGANRMAILS